MKNLMIIFLCGFIIQTVAGQNEKPIIRGNFIAGGSLSFNIEKNRDIHPPSSTDLGITFTNNIKTIETDLYFGYFLIDHLALGIKTYISITNNKFTNSLTTGSSSYYYNQLLIGPLLRYYTTSGLFLEGSASIGFLYYNSKDTPEKWRNYSLSTGIGYSLFINETIALEPEITYNYLHRGPYQYEESEYKSNGLNFSIGLQIYLSIKNLKDKNQ